MEEYSLYHTDMVLLERTNIFLDITADAGLGLISEKPIIYFLLSSGNTFPGVRKKQPTAFGMDRKIQASGRETKDKCMVAGLCGVYGRRMEKFPDYILEKPQIHIRTAQEEDKVQIRL